MKQAANVGSAKKTGLFANYALIIRRLSSQSLVANIT